MYRLSFCSLTIISETIVEIIFDDKVDISLAMVNEFWAFIHADMTPPVHVILNKKYPYSYQFDALIPLSDSAKIQSIAVVSYNEASTESAKYLKRMFNKSGKRIEIFSTRDVAMQWIKEVADTPTISK